MLLDRFQSPPYCSLFFHLALKSKESHVGNEEEEAVGRTVSWAVQRWVSALITHFQNDKMLYFSLL